MTNENVIEKSMMVCLSGSLYLLVAIYFPVLSVGLIGLITIGAIVMIATKPFQAIIALLRLGLLFFLPYVAFKFEIFVLIHGAVMTFFDKTYSEERTWEGPLPSTLQRFVLVPFHLLMLLFMPEHVINCLYWTNSDADDISVRDIPAYIVNWSAALPQAE